MTDSTSDPQKNAPPPSPEPPRGPRIWLLTLIVIMIAVGFVGGSIWGDSAIQSARQAMKTISARLASADRSEPESEQTDSKDQQYYTCGMHPWIILPEPGPCPICHMELTPLDPAKFTGEINIDPVVTQNIGVRIEPVVSGPLVRTIRTVGSVAYDETRVRDVNIRVPGWIQELHVDYEGASVKIGDPLFEYDSPQLYSAQSEYLLALKMRDSPGRRPLAGSQLDADRLVADAYAQLEYYGVTPEQIESLERSSEAAGTMTMQSPHTGIVIAKHANEGMRVDQGMRVYRIADLSKVWVMVALYEYQLPFIKEGQDATMTLPYLPGQTIEGKVIYIYPYLDEKTRQATVRLEFDNPNLLLKPGMFANIELKNTLARDRTLVPRSAVLDTGERQVAFVSLGDGRFDPRDVLMGVETDGGQVEIIDGLKPGEMVVTGGLFLLDSEARIRESLSKMIKGNLASEQGAVVEVAGASELRTLPAEVESGLSTVLESYFEIANSLSTDSTSGTATPAQRLTAILDELITIEIPEALHFWHEHEEVATAREKATALAESSDLEESRLLYADLSVALAKLIKATGVPPGYGADVQQLHCPMFRQGQGGSIWLQPTGEVRNPFLGSAMIECFDERTTLPVTGEDPTIEYEDESGGSNGVDERDGALNPANLDVPAQAAIDALIGAYLQIYRNLTGNDISGMDEPIRTIRASLDTLDEYPPEGLEVVLGGLRDASALNTQSIESFRTGFEALSDAVIALVQTAPPSDVVGHTIYQAYCPMAKANWLQTSRTVANPYLSKMPTCGSIQQEFKAVASSGVSQ